MVDHLQPVLEAGTAVRDLREVVLPERLLAVPEEGAVVGRDHGERVGAHRVPEHAVVRGVAGRRRVDVLRALEAGLCEVVYRPEEVLRARLTPDAPALLARTADRLDRLAAGDVDDVERRGGDSRELDGSVRRLALELGRPRDRVVDRLGVPLGERLADEDVDRVTVLGVNHHERAARRGDLHRAEERLVVDLQDVLVGHEELVRGDALLGQRGELLQPFLVGEIGDRDVEAVVDQCLAVRLRVPSLEGLRERLALSLDAEVHVAGRAAAGRRPLAGLEVVDRDRAAERHVEMGVRVDAARQDVLPARVDRPFGRDVEVGADERDALALDEDVGDEVVGGGDDAPSADQDGHRLRV